MSFEFIVKQKRLCKDSRTVLGSHNDSGIVPHYNPQPVYLALHRYEFAFEHLKVNIRGFRKKHINF